MDNMPDFDKMTPEEINTWLESLAKRQGATEGFTTAADMQVAEIDPNSVTIDEPGYVPYGQEAKPAAKPAEPVRQAAPPPAPPPVVQKPLPVPPPAVPERPAARVVTPPPPPPPPQPAAEQGGMAWLESLAGGEDDSLFNLDLSSLSTDEPAPAPEPPLPVSSISWLENLARADDEPIVVDDLVADDSAIGDVDQMEWLESLARRQGADTEELITPAHLDIPLPEPEDIEAPNYTAFSFDTPPVAKRTPAPVMQDPTDFLSSLADDEPLDTPVEPVSIAARANVRAVIEEADEDSGELSLDAIQQAIAAGTVTREQMQFFLERQADAIAAEPEYDMLEPEDEGELAPADLPDWLLEQVGVPPAPSAPSAGTAGLESLFGETPASDDMPDWLKENIEEREAAVDFEDLFGAPEAESESVPVASAPPAGVEIDPNDTWAEAFDLEHDAGAIDVQNVPDWYERNVNDPTRRAAVEEMAMRGRELEDSPLPAEDLPVGETQGVPGWIPQPEPELEAETSAEASAEAFTESPEPAFADWLSELEDPSSVEVPDWLTEPVVEEQPVQEVEVPPLPAEPVVVSPPARPVVMTPPPAPRPPVSSEALERARDREQNGDLEGSLGEYEGLIRANIELDTVVADLAQLVKSYRTVPAVYRVLGDGLMRQGKLQQALNTYREALNQL